MELALKLKDSDKLTVEAKGEIDKFIENTIAIHKGNANQINRLVMESVTALTVSKTRSKELAEQGTFKRFFGGLTGKNQDIRADIDRNLAKSQYASQMMIQKLAEQNLMTFDLVTAVNNKLNTLVLDIEEEINEIYNTLVVFFKQTRADIIQLESRMDKLERNVKFLQWNATIEYQLYNGKEYSELNDVEKICCVVNDFFHISEGKWETSDLMLLKPTLAEIGLPVKSKISPKQFFQYLIGDMGLIERLLMDISLNGLDEIKPYEVPLLKGIEKILKIEKEEKYIVNTIISQLELANVQCDTRNIQLSMIQQYMKDSAFVMTEVEVGMFDFIVELLLNLKITNDCILEKNTVIINETEAADGKIIDNQSSKNEELLYDEATRNHIGNKCGNITNGGITAIQGDWIFYRNYEDAYKLYKVKTDGTEKTKINDDASMYINVAGNWSYYIKDFDKCIYKIKVNGTEECKLNDEPSKYLTVVGDWVFYTNESDDKIYKLKTDGSEKIKLTNEKSLFMNVTDKWIFYCLGLDKSNYISSEHFEHLSVIKINLNGLERTLLTSLMVKFYENHPALYLVADEKVVCGIGSEICVMDYDGGNYRQISTQRVPLYIKTTGGCNFYGEDLIVSSCDGEKYASHDTIMKVKLQNKSKKNLYKGTLPKSIPEISSEFKNINIIKDWVFFERENKLYRMSAMDGNDIVPFI